MARQRKSFERAFFEQRFKRKPENDKYYFNEWVERIARAKARGIQELSGVADTNSMKILKKLIKQRKGFN